MYLPIGFTPGNGLSSLSNIRMSLKQRSWTDHHDMVIDTYESQLSTSQQVRDFLAGTADVTFAAAEDDAVRYRFNLGASRTWQNQTRHKVIKYFFMHVGHPPAKLEHQKCHFLKRNCHRTGKSDRLLG